MSFERIKSTARENLRGHWPEVIVTVLIYLALTQLFTNQQRVVEISSRGTQFSGTSAFFNLLSFIVSGPLSYGLMIFFRRLREKTANIADLFIGFKRFGDTFLLHFFSTLFILLWTLVLIVPGIIAAIRYSMAYLIMTENPDMSGLEAIDASKMLMDGHKSEYFGFTVSFIGWFLLSILTFGIGFLFLIPYFNAAKVEFYEVIKRSADDYLEEASF